MAWLKGIPAADLALSAITIQEIRSGTESMSPGRKRREVEHWLETDILQGFSERILAIDAAIADLCGRLITKAIHQGHTPSLDDALIAATARAHGLRLATLNRRHFVTLDVDLVDLT